MLGEYIDSATRNIGELKIAIAEEISDQCNLRSLLQWSIIVVVVVESDE